MSPAAEETVAPLASLDIVIVNWNSGSQLKRCLDSIESADEDGLKIERVVLVDNDSSDGSIEGLEWMSLPLELIRNSKNRGYGRACNQGAANGCSDYILFLNPDTCLFPGSLAGPLVFMEQPQNCDFGITGIQLVDESGQANRGCARFPTLGRYYAHMLALDRLIPGFFHSVIMTDWDHSESRVVDHVMGAFFMVRRSVFEALGGFDERFFVYYEDLDFSLRANRAGWKSMYLAEPHAFHRGGGTSEQVPATRLFYSLRSQILFGRKHLSRPQYLMMLAGTLVVEPFTRLVLALAHLSAHEIDQTARAYMMLVRSMPAMTQSRDIQ